MEKGVSRRSSMELKGSDLHLDINPIANLQKKVGRQPKDAK
jgi:hypothetical protein